jgi:hypothetical protein
MRLGDGFGHRVNAALDFRCCAGAPGHFQIIEVLQIQPKLRIGFEVSGQSQCRVRGNATPFVNNLG